MSTAAVDSVYVVTEFWSVGLGELLTFLAPTLVLLLGLVLRDVYNRGTENYQTLIRLTRLLGDHLNMLSDLALEIRAVQGACNNAREAGVIPVVPAISTPFEDALKLRDEIQFPLRDHVILRMTAEHFTSLAKMHTSTRQLNGLLAELPYLHNSSAEERKASLGRLTEKCEVSFLRPIKSYSVLAEELVAEVTVVLQESRPIWIKLIHELTMTRIDDRDGKVKRKLEEVREEIRRTEALSQEQIDEWNK